MRHRMSLAGQLLALQLGIVFLVLVGVAAVSLAQSDARFRETEGQRARSAAESVAATVALRDALEAKSLHRSPDEGHTVFIRSAAESARSVSGATSVIVTDIDGVIIASADPDQLDKRLRLPGNPLVTRRGWLGEVEVDGRGSMVAQAPVISDGPESLGRPVGAVAVVRERPSVLDNLREATPNLLTYLGLASAFGVVGSLLLARRVKHQTLGLEPLEITGLVEHREALLHGIKEGVIALDHQQRITLINDEAIELLRLAPGAVGTTLGELGLDPGLGNVLTGRASGPDLAVPVGDRLLILNRMPIASRGRPLGSVTTLRDRTELITLQRELNAVQHATDTLRAQAHEFSNRLHTISGLIELGEYGEVAGYVQRVTARQAELTACVTSRVADPAVAALVVAKGSLAAEQGVELRFAASSRLGQIDEDLSTDVVTVVGNLVDNALDALGPGPGGWVEVEVRGGDPDLPTGDPEVVVTVRDSGPGVAADVAGDVFRRGVSTKAAGGGAGGQRGFGLALVQLACVRRGGDVSTTNDGGAVFVARLPIRVRASA